MDIYALTGFINAITSIVLGILVFAKGREKAANRIFAYSTIPVFLWAMAYGFWLLADNHDTALFLVRILMMGAIFIPFSYAHFVVAFTKSHQYDWWIRLGYIFAGLAVLANFTPLFVADVVPKMGFDFWPVPGILFHPFLLIWAIYSLLQVALLFKAHRTAHGIYRQQLGYIMIGFIIGIVGGSTNYLLWYDIPVLPFGNIGASIDIILISYIIIRLRLFDIKIQTQNVFNVLAPMFFAIGFAMSAAYAFLQLTNWELKNVGVVILCIGLVVYELMRRWLDRSRLRYAFFSRTHKYQEALKNLAAEASTIVDITELSERILAALTEDMRIQKAAIIISPRPYQAKAFELLEHVGCDEKKSAPFIDPSEMLLQAFRGSRLSFIADEIKFEVRSTHISQKQRTQLQAVESAMATTQANVVLGLRVKDTLLGFLILGNKQRGSYTVEDVNLLEEISNQLAVALMHSRMHEEKTVLTRMLREEVAQATNAWREKSKENEELSNVKSQFIEVASHQLRTPISVIRNSLQMVLEDYLKEQKNLAVVQECTPLLRNAFLASDNLNNSINSILAAEEFIDKKPSVHVKRIKTETFLAQRVRRAQGLLEAKSGEALTLHTEYDTSLPEYVVTDEEKLGMIIDQILMNAVLYTKEGTVTVSATRKDDHLLIRVKDTGIGIGDEQGHSIFERFVRLKNAQSVVPDGTGLGLYLAQQYVELLRGKMSFTSEEGVGTTFTISIPVEYTYV